MGMELRSGILGMFIPTRYADKLEKSGAVRLLAALPALIAIALPAPAQAGEQAPFYREKAKMMVYLDSQGMERQVGTQEDWGIRRGHILSNMQAVMGPLPDDSRRVPLDAQTTEEVKLAGCTRRKITFAVEKGDRVPAYLLIPDNLQGRAPAMLCLHQTTGHGKGEPAGLAGSPNLFYALELAGRGYVTLAPDYPGYGEYSCDAYALGYASATMKGIWNHMRAVDLLQSLDEADGKRIGCIGHSLGGHNTLFVAAFDPRIKVAVSSCGFNAFPKYMGGNLKGWTHRGYMPRIAEIYGADPARMPFDFPEVLAAIAPRAVFVNAPRMDSNFEVSGVVDCLRAAAPVYGLFNAEERLVAAHPDTGHDFPPDIRAKAYAFIDEALKQDM